MMRSAEFGNMKEDLKNLWRDERPWKRRLLLALLPSFTLCFTFFFFGPIEIASYNTLSLYFNAAEITPVMGGFTLVIFVVLTLFLSLLKGKLFNYAVSAVFIVTICGYLQANILNGFMAELTGDAIDWEDKTVEMAAGLFVWLLIAFVSFGICKYFQKYWFKAVVFVSALLILMQSVALVEVYATNRKAMGSNNILFAAEMFDCSPKENSFVIVLDRLDYDWVEDILAEDPDFFDGMDGFTAYHDATSEYARTIPAMSYMLTTYTDGLYRMPYPEFCDNAWTLAPTNILKDLTAAGYQINLYTDYDALFGRGDTAVKYVSNCTSKSLDLDVVGILTGMIELSLYRYMPIALKPFFWCSTDAVNSKAYKDAAAYETSEVYFAAEMDSINTNVESNSFKLIHLNGSHGPWILDENGDVVEKSTVLDHTRGCFQLLFRFFDQLKALGIYDGASIIITADHGAPISDDDPVQKVTKIGLFYKAPGSSGSMLKDSNAPVSLRNIPATVIKGAGLDYSGYGEALDDVREDVIITRLFSKYVRTGGVEEVYVYEITGDASDFSNWRNTDIYPITE